ncbi:MAG: hypothetical protein M0R66_07325 [Candidatus Omnitrophica bacterium]|jgi:hypothetical protein|nr:hypothetical protein [Candidatus Omnitrophota bacterium]
MSALPIAAPFLALGATIPFALVSGGEAVSLMGLLERFAGWGVVAWVVYYFVTKNDRTQREFIATIKEFGASVQISLEKDREAQEEAARVLREHHAAFIRLQERIKERCEQKPAC